MAVKEYALKDMVDVYGDAFEQLYNENKGLLLEAVGMNSAKGVHDVTAFLNRKAKEIHRGDFSYFDNNENLVSILESTHDKPSRIIRAREVSDGINMLPLAVQREASTYVFMYILNGLFD